MPPERARFTQEAFARFSLSALDLDALLRVWSRRGCTWREYNDGSIELLTPGGAPITRGTRDHIEGQLRARLRSIDWPLVPA